MRSKRRIRCEKCEGSGTDSEGSRCGDCSGSGSFAYGADRERAEIEKDLASTRLIRDEDLAELGRAKAGLNTAKPELRPGIIRQIQMIGESVDYWDAQVKGLETELADCDRRVGAG